MSFGKRGAPAPRPASEPRSRLERHRSRQLQRRTASPMLRYLRATGAQLVTVFAFAFIGLGLIRWVGEGWETAFVASRTTASAPIDKGSACETEAAGGSSRERSESPCER